jgi:hypothetical protein
MMSASGPGLGTKASDSWLTVPAKVVRYMQRTGFPLHVNHVQRLKGGMINFVYRLFLKPDDTGGIDSITHYKSAILKFSAPFVAHDPSIQVPHDRQVFEARAFTNIPWQHFDYSRLVAEHRDAALLCSGVSLPKVYFEDAANHVVIMEDCDMEADGDPHPEKAANPFRFFCEHVTTSAEKYQTARFIGSALGSFLAQTHIWGLSADNHARAVELFADNKDSITLLEQVQIRDFFANLDKIGCQLSIERRAELEGRIEQLGRDMHAHHDTVVIGDFQ